MADTSYIRDLFIHKIFTMNTLKQWNILIADDDEKIHRILVNPYFNEDLLGKPVSFITAKDKTKTFEILKEKHNEIAVILYDIALASDNNLEVIDFIRIKLQNKKLQIIIRSDKSINFSDKEITDNYVIHDYIDDDNTDGTLIFTLKSAVSTYNDIEQLEKQNRIIEQQKNELESSIKAASYIQKALFPKKKILKKHFPNSFIIHKPHQKVSGDFYYFSNILGKHIIITADCTGHGVPASLTSMLGLSFLKRIIETDKVFDPANILTKLDNEILKIFKNKEAEGTAHDGMDISICTIDLENKTLLVSGAVNSVILIHKNSIKEIEVSKYGIGHLNTKEKNFITEQHVIEKGDIIFMFSDGFYGQVSEKKDRPFGKRKFHGLLRKTVEKNMKNQKNKLLKHFLEIKGKNEQTDDILIIGIKIP